MADPPIEGVEAERCPDTEHEPEHNSEDGISLWSRCDLARAVRGSDDGRGGEQNLQRSEALLLPEKLLVRAGPCRAGSPELCEPSLELSPRAGQAGRVGLELVRRERLRIRGGEARRNVRLAAVDAEREDVRIRIGGDVGAPARGVLESGFLDGEIEDCGCLGEPCLRPSVPIRIRDGALRLNPGDGRCDVLPVQQHIRSRPEHLRLACGHHVGNSRDDEYRDDDHPLVAPDDGEVVGDRLLS